MVVDGIHGAVKGTVRLSELGASWDEMDRYVRDSPRQRTLQNIDEMEALNSLLNT